MEILANLLDVFLHLDEHLQEIIQNYGTLTYLIFFLIVFAETGLVVTPFLPGDTLLFAAGMFSAQPEFGLNVWLVSLTFMAAALTGDVVNYNIGRFVGPKVFRGGKESRFFKREYLDRTHEFYERYGWLTIIIARFVPIVRTFAPFVAGIGRMTFGRYICFSLLGAFLWVLVCVGAGYTLGRIPVVRDNFELAIVGLLALSVIPIVIKVVHQRIRKRKAATVAAEE